MKKLLLSLLLVLEVFSFAINVFAQEFHQQDLIPIDTVATVETERFTYQDFILQITAENKGIVNFASIVNNSDKKIPISINLLLFDDNKLNIGYLTYCTEKDLSSNYTDFKLAPNGSSPFTINVVSKYFIEDKAIEDVKFISVMDDNKYCHVGGYDKYQGLKIEQIKDGKVAANVTGKGKTLDLFAFLKNKSVMIIIGFCSVLILVIVIIGSILNALYKRMFVETTPMAYIPLLSNYVAVKLVFGRIIGKIYLLVLFLSVGLCFIGTEVILLVMNVLAIFSFLMVIVKLITKKYDLFYFEPTVRNNLNNNSSSTINSNNNSVNNFIGSEFASTSSMKKEETLDDDVVDLSYGSSLSNSSSNDNGISTGISAGKGPLSDNDVFGGMFNQNNTDDAYKNTNSSEGESDLSKFFK